MRLNHPTRTLTVSQTSMAVNLMSAALYRLQSCRPGVIIELAGGINTPSVGTSLLAQVLCSGLSHALTS